MDGMYDIRVRPFLGYDAVVAVPIVLAAPNGSEDVAVDRPRSQTVVGVQPFVALDLLARWRRTAARLAHAGEQKRWRPLRDMSA
jgi:hypothetical protein